MFLGEYEHTLDEKKRVSLPKAFRTALGKRMVMTRGLDNCLFVYSKSSWEKVAAKLDQLSFAQDNPGESSAIRDVEFIEMPVRQILNRCDNPNARDRVPASNIVHAHRDDPPVIPRADMARLAG